MQDAEPEAKEGTDMFRDLVYVALFAALIAALGLIPKITLASGVPITAQSLGIMLCGTVLGARRGAYAVLLFLFLVALGLPLLAGGRGGLGLFASPSAGYLIGFPVGAYVTGAIMENWKIRSDAFVAFIAALAGGVIVVAVFGTAGMAVTLDKSIAEAALLALPFIPGDVLKAVVAAAITALLVKNRPESVMSRG